ncbi:MAG: preprotein translocase subunit SecG [Pseudoxanthomonas sp.]
MIHTIINVLYVLVAISMIVLILLQRGAGAQAGSGFGAGASGTVFGARGSANFLSSTTKFLALVFFVMSLGMTYMASHEARSNGTASSPSIMSDLPPDAGKPVPTAPAPLAPAPVAPAATAPVIAPATAPAAASDAPNTAAPPAAAPAGSTPPAQGSKGG